MPSSTRNSKNSDRVEIAGKTGYGEGQHRGSGDAAISSQDRRNIDTFLLAVHRTELANRRTLLAYVKTAIALCAAAVALLKLLHDEWLGHVGWILLPIALITLLIGIADYQRVKKSINEEKKDGGL